MSEVVVEFAGAGDGAHGSGKVPPPFSGPTDDLLAFLSFLAAERYGSLHELSAAARLLRRELGIDTRPLFEFGDAVVEDDEDRVLLERLWQEPAPLAQAAAASAQAFRAEPRLQTLARAYPELASRLDDLAAMARWAAETGARIRITYRL